MSLPTLPDRDCGLCPRLAAYREDYRALHPDWFNAPVPSFGPATARLLVVGQAPGVNGANRTGRPFTGDVAGRLLYPVLTKFGFAKGSFQERPDDGLKLVDCRITNAVRCAPPQHKLETSDKNHCLPYLAAEIAAMKKLRVLLAIGGKAHESILQGLGLKASQHKFKHGALHELPNGLVLADSFHTSQYNVNTGRITQEMFEEIVAGIRRLLA
ncbi:uracil-DNA glycosylase [Acidocella aminolytica]|uniref:Type-5 uracil-DNA glycosylase n=1 Tax=Acidocella aminolytica 101 = DSM 11237 TaxID=1120923 RepID=A0A0D6PKR5_9PROT|nr:uracil-DNA glycosylase [Acidocella aminolytica]GAN81793.1 uracil-DNA glycosylase [Acidocella aminolytica 101 = DSM 11237]GBQ35123.1 uracil-DNA glycosylase [Acidocella aminolytica 101 = DSM 11237]SHE81007.1 uracil-DNA glycosylase, family 4 [Acidocella aminolytica 101 = DSM 11237]